MKTLFKLAAWLLMGMILSACDTPQSLFDGKSLEGWACDPPEQAGDWKALEGELLGENPGEQASIIWTTGPQGTSFLSLGH